MYIGRTRCNANLSLNVNMLPVVDRVEDLCVIVDPLTFTYHIDQIVAKTFVLTWYTNVLCHVTSLFNSCFYSLGYVRPLLEYASPVWSPPHVGKLTQIVSVQRRFTKCLPGSKHVVYKDRLERLGVETVETQRLRQDLVFTYKVTFGLVSGSCNELFIMSNSSISTQCHAYKLFQHHSHFRLS